MYFHIEERQSWIRTGTHTVVFDCDPDFPRFAKDPGGNIQRIVRVWLADPKPVRPYKRAYLGAIMLFANRARLSQLRRMFRTASVHATHSGQSSKHLRRKLIATLRKHICHECKNKT